MIIILYLRVIRYIFAFLIYSPLSPHRPIDFFSKPYLGSAEKVFRWGLGVGVWGVGFYPFSGGQLPNFQGKSPGIFPPITPMVGTF